MAGLVLIWVSVAAITVGTHLQTLSPRFKEFRLATIREEAGTGPGERLNPAGRMALELSFTWQYGCCFSGFFALLFTAGGLGIRAAGRWNRELALVAAGAFGLGCLVGAALGAGEALRSFRWGFFALGVGFLFSGAGLGLGGLGVVWLLVTDTRHAEPGAAADGGAR
jgi:hypothetical protein